jgi:RimJ/RimL family protein N-acetyltransferase
MYMRTLLNKPDQPAIHTPPFFELTSPHPELFTYIPFNPLPSIAAMNNAHAARTQPDPGAVLFAIIDKTRTDSFNVDKDGAFAGSIGLEDTSVHNLSTEIGFIIILPEFQRTHVTSNAVGLLLQYTLDLPSDGGLGLRRVQWQCNDANAASVRAAERMTFRREALLRWDRVMHGGWQAGKIGNNRAMPRCDVVCEDEGPKKQEEMGRDTLLFSICHDDWDYGGKERVKSVMERL